MTEITATVDNGILRPDASLPFPDQTRVRLTIETIERGADFASAWERSKHGYDNGLFTEAGSTIRETNFMNAVDTNVLVYALDADEPVKQATSQRLLDQLIARRGETLLLWQVAGEFLSCLRKWQAQGKMSTKDVEANFRDIIASFPLRLPAASIFAVSFMLSSQYSLSHWDSLLIAGCKEAGIDVLYSEDLDHGTDYDGVRVINPFA